MEGSLVAYKVFTNGSVLPASDVNTYLMDQSVMVFSSSATRAAALTAPVEGMLTWLQDTNQYEYYTGAGAWAPLSSSGLVLLSTTSFSAVASQAIPVGSFSASYDFYRVICDLTNATSDANIFVKMRASGTDSSLSYYGAVGNVSVTGTYASSAVNNGISGFLVSEVDSGTASNHRSSFVMDLQRPFAATNTTMQVLASATSSLGAVYSNFGGGVHQVSTSYDQINVIASAGNITGKIQVYGYSQ